MNKIKLFILLLFVIIFDFNITAQGQEHTPNPSQEGNSTPNNDAQHKLNNVDKQFFIENKGQWNSDVLYLTRIGGLDAWITKKGINYTFYKLEEVKQEESNNSELEMPDKFEHKDYNIIGHRVLMNLIGSNPKASPEGKIKQTAYYNYFIGNDDNKHASNVGLYKEALVKNVYTGIDMRYYFDIGLLRYDYIVHPGAEPNQIRFSLEGSDKTYLNEKGELIFTTCFGEVKNTELYCYQNEDKKTVNATFTKQGESWKIELGAYDKNQTLIIDPLIYSTYIGGSATEEADAIALDASNNAYITGYTLSFNYDTTSGAFQTTYGGGRDVFVSKLNATGTALLYSTYIGGSNDDSGNSITIDTSGNAFVTGATKSSDYDITIGAYQTTYGGGTYDVFVSKLNATGTALLYSTYIGGSGYDVGSSITIDASGNALVTGSAGSNFDITPSAYQTSYGGNGDVFVTKLNPSGTALLYSTYIGGSGYDVGRSIAIDASGNAFVTGQTVSTNYDITPGVYQTSYGGNGDVFVSKLNSDGTALLYSTYIGGSNDDFGLSIAIDTSGNAFVTGYTTSTNYDITPGAYQTTYGGSSDAFVTKLNPDGTALLYSTYIGGSGNDRCFSFAIDIFGNAFLAGYTNSTNFDITPDAYQTTYGGTYDVFVTKLNPSGTALLYSTYIGGNNDDKSYSIAIDTSGNAYITGYTEYTGYDITAGVYQTINGGIRDVFVTKIGLYPCTQTTGTDSIIACDSLVWVNGNTYFNSINTPTIVFANSVGCDSVVTLNLTIKNSTSSTDIVTACDSITWIDGITYTASTNSPTFILTNTAGCDSVVTLNLTINANSNIDVITACDSITWVDGNTYAASTNTPTYTLTNEAGCDSVITLNLIINANSSIDVITACDSITWIDGNTYTTSTNIPTFTLTNAAGCDSIVTLNLTINNLTSNTDIITACDSITWINGITYTSSNNTATYTLINSLGCDSLVTLNLTINSATTGTYIITACDSITWIDGNIYTASTNSPTFTLTNTAGCDSVVTLDLTINSTTTGTDVITACDSITWIDGNTYTTNTNTPTFTLTNSVGCDSVVTLDLIINNSNSSTDVVTACDSITWIDGITYTTSTNSPTFTLANAVGCDSVVTLDLTINNSTLSTDVITACDSITWIDGNTYTLSTNTPTFTLTNTVGCDSVVTLDLTINNPTSGINTQTACEFYTWIDGNTYTASTNTPTFTIVGGAANGCDSIITLNLTINNSTTSTDVQTACNSYVWIDGNTYTANNNTATFTLTNSADCDSVVTLNLTINNSTTSTDVQTACKTYTWIDGNTYFSSTSLPTVNLTNAMGCDSIITLNLTIVSPVTTTQTFTECQGFSITFGSNTYTTTGVFTDVINGCDTMITNLTINDAPQFTLIKEDDNCGEHVGSILVNVTSSIPPVTYVWNTGSSDSIISNLPAGTYTVAVNDGSGCSNANTTSVLDLNLDCETFIFIPSVFTPNSDGQNDEFIIQLKGLEFISLEIYNRWGTKLFESTTKNKGWDGKTNTSTNATDGTYFFIVSYKTTDDEIMTKKGTLTLLR